MIRRATVVANQKNIWMPVDGSAAIARDVQEGAGPEIVPESVEVVALRIAFISIEKENRA